MVMVVGKGAVQIWQMTNHPLVVYISALIRENIHIHARYVFIHT